MRSFAMLLVVVLMTSPVAGEAPEKKDAKKDAKHDAKHEKNPLLREELTPIKNPSFERGFLNWVPSTAKRHEIEARGVVLQVEPVAYDGKQSLSMELTRNGEYYLSSPTLSVPRDQQYYLSARIRTEGEITASIRPIAGAGNESTSAWVPFDQDWTEVGVAFTATSKANVAMPRGVTAPEPGKSYTQLRLKVRGVGKAYFDDIRIYRTHKYAPYLRVKLLQPTGRKYRVRFYGLVGPPNWYDRRTFFDKEGVDSGKHSPWISLASVRAFQGNRRNSIGIHFEPLEGDRFQHIKAELQFASAPDKPVKELKKEVDLLADDPLDLTKPKKSKPGSGLYEKVARESGPGEQVFTTTLTQATLGDTIGVFVPSSSMTPAQFVSGFAPLASDIHMRNEHVRSLGLPPIRLKHFYIEAHHKGFEHFFTDPKLLETEIDTLRQIGFSALDSQYAGLAGTYRQLAEKTGLAQTHQTTVGHTLVEDPVTHKAVFDETKLREQIAQRVDQWFARMRKDDPKQIEKIKFFVLCDEIWGVGFEGPEFAEGYRKYLKGHNITPQDLGKKDYREIDFQTSWSWRDTWGHCPKDRSDLVACRDYYWRLRYWSHATARVYRLISEEVNRQAPGIPTVVNHGLPWAYGYDGYMRGVEIFEFSRQKSMSAFIHEDWLNTSGWRHSGIQLCGYLADFSRSVAKVSGADAYAYVMPGRKQAIQLKLATVVGKGIKIVDLYRYGPAYGSPDNWSQNLPQTEGVARYLRKLAAAENIAGPGKPRAAQTAILWSASNEAWRETEASIYDRQLTYLALAHQQIPVDFVDEFSIEAGDLKQYKVAYLGARYLRGASQQALAQWVSQGGQLWVDALAGTADEYGQPSKTLLPALGIKEYETTLSENRRHNPQHNIPNHKPLDTITFADSGETVEAIGRKMRVTLSDPDNTQVLATFADQSPAVYQHTFGKGKVYVVGTAAGLTYARPVERLLGKIETGYRHQERRLITDFALAAGIQRPVACNVAGVQADLLESKQGIALVLANFTGTPQETITLQIHTPRPISKVISVDHGELKFQQDAASQTITVRLPLELVDFVTLQE